LNFESHIGGVPQLPEGIANKYFTPLELMKFNANGILYGVIAGMDAWKDAGLKFAEDDKEPDWDSGMIYGIGSLAVDKLNKV
jgi:3-oxoacyl-[acyl-carrier-protein] synthase-1